MPAPPAAAIHKATRFMSAGGLAGSATLRLLAKAESTSFA